MEQIKCQLIAGNNEYKEKYVMVESDGSIVEESVDIGGEDWKYKWPSSITKFDWRLYNHTPDILSEYIQQRVFATAFQSIALLIKKKYHYVDYPKQAHFNIEFLTDLSVFDNKPSVLAQMYLYATGSNKNGLCQFNDNHFFTPLGNLVPAWIADPAHYTEGEKNSNGTLKMLGSQPMLEIGMHELCHGHGYRHDTVHPESLMQPYVKQGYIDGKVNEAAFLWSHTDIQRWQEGYDPRTISPIWNKYFQTRRIKGLDYL